MRLRLHLIVIALAATAAAAQPSNPEGVGATILQILRSYPSPRPTAQVAIVSPMPAGATALLAGPLRGVIPAVPVTAKRGADADRELARLDLYCIVAVDVPADVRKAIAKLARTRKILTISTNRKDVEEKDGLALAIVYDGTVMRAYRSDRELQAEGVTLPAAVKSIARSVSAVEYAENYRQGIRAWEFRDYPALEVRMRDARETAPDSTENIIIYGLRIQRYLPNAYLGLSYAARGQCTEAMDVWRVYDTQPSLLYGTPEAGLIKKYKDQCVAKEATKR
jgi:hypothetical protein